MKIRGTYIHTYLRRYHEVEGAFVLAGGVNVVPSQTSAKVFYMWSVRFPTCQWRHSTRHLKHVVDLVQDTPVTYHGRNNVSTIESFKGVLSYWADVRTTPVTSLSWLLPLISETQVMYTNDCYKHVLRFHNVATVKMIHVMSPTARDGHVFSVVTVVRIPSSMTTLSYWWLVAETSQVVHQDWTAPSPVTISNCSSFASEIHYTVYWSHFMGAKSFIFEIYLWYS